VQILKRAKNAEMDIVSATESEKNVREEVNRRTAKAGYTTKYGEPTSSGRIISKPATKQYRKNYRRIFGHD